MIETHIELWPVYLIILSSIISTVSGLPLLFRIVAPAAGQRIATGFMVLSAATGLTGALSVLVRHIEAGIEFNWHLPFGPMTCSVDPLSAFFTIPVFIVAACCSFYSIGYWPAEKKIKNIRKLIFFFGILASAMIWVVMARSAALFLFAWEIMAISAFFVLTTDDEDIKVREAGILYLICTHIGTLCLFVLFALLSCVSGSFVFPGAGSIETGSTIPNIIFLLGIAGFGIKAGIMPFHIWLPSAHANAPSHVSAIMSGVILKIGIYGLFRLLSFFTTIPLWWGFVILGIGLVSGVFGVVFAIAQHDLKRLLAYSSIENIGIIMMGFGIALIGMSEGSSLLVLLGMAGALLHIMNHATFKALLFLGAGSVIHALGTREIDRMGGLIHTMPRTAIFFLIGAIALCGLPPLNGFVSELFIYLGLFNSAVHGHDFSAVASALAAPVLALIGGLALACFVKVFGVVFLGQERYPSDKPSHESCLSMRIPMAVLVFICAAIGLAPYGPAYILESIIKTWNHSITIDIPLTEVASLKWISIMAIAILSSVVFLYIINLRDTVAKKTTTWGCGYAAPTPRMQYTASSFADMLVSLFVGILRTDIHKPKINSFFPVNHGFSNNIPEAVLEKICFSVLHWTNGILSTVRKFQHGKLYFYILYIFLTLIILTMIPN